MSGRAALLFAFAVSCQPYRAEDGVSGGDGGASTDADSAANADAAADAASAPPSCVGAAVRCGPTGSADCCASARIPGGTYSRSFDGIAYDDATFIATVSDFRLDVFEITVGRFRAFAESYPASLPVSGAGKNPNDPTDGGWDPSWAAAMPADRAALLAQLKCNPDTQTWTDDVGGNETKPVNCLTWYAAFAFCVWDGGRLPTEAEWNYAATGGKEQRVYPWSNPPTSTTIDRDHVVYATSTSAQVGSKSPLGDSKWGPSDLAGNVKEWVIDAFASPYAITPCRDCADHAPRAERVRRGGGFKGSSPDEATSYRDSSSPDTSGDVTGARCARPL